MNTLLAASSSKLLLCAGLVVPGIIGDGVGAVQKLEVLLLGGR